MKILAILILLSIQTAINSKVDTTNYYSTLSSNSETEINKILKLLETEENTLTNKAYRGALIAKKADFANFPAEKLKLFRIGVDLIELAVKEKPENVEFRFLRLVIQEKSPGIVGYKDNLQEDKNIIYKHFSTLSTPLKLAIKDYAKNSAIINNANLK